MAPALLFLGAAASLATTFLMPTVSAEPGSIATDDRGFIGTAARCEEPSFGVAFGRTPRSLVAICVDAGQYEYRGVRLRDNALLSAAAAATGDGEFRAENGGVTYTFSAQELVIASGDRVIRTEPMVSYMEPRLAAEG